MRLLRTRLPRLLWVWVAAAAAEAILYYFFLSRPYFRDFFLPFGLVVVIGAGVATWRGVRGRRLSDRRSHERRRTERRAAK